MTRTLTISRSVLFLTFILLAACSGEQGTDTAEQTPPPAASLPPTPASVSDPAMPHTGVVEGTVTDASGQAVAGAFVKLDIPERRLTFMVISQDGGRYRAEKLPSGAVSVQAVGGDYQSDWSAPVAVSNGMTSAVDVSLTVERGPDLPAAWPRRVPEQSASLEALPPGPGKDILAAKCTGCHGASQVIASRYDAATWASTVEDMSELTQGSGLPEVSEEEAGVLLEYLTANLAPLPAPDPNSRLPHELMQGEARNYRTVQYNLETTEVETHDVAVDPQGIGWANQRTGGRISRFDPVTYEYTEIEPPLLFDAKRARPGNLQISSEGIMWLADPFSKRWLSYDIANDKWTDWMFPMEPERGPVPGVNPVVHYNGTVTNYIRGQVQGNSLVIHHDGTIWMSGPGAVRRLDPTTGEWSTWDSPTWIATQKNPGGYGITVDGKGYVWEAENLVDKLARYDGETGEVKVFDLEPGAYPRRMDYDNNGDVYVGLWGTSKVLKIDHTTTEMTEILPPLQYNGAYSIDFDKSTNLMWVTLQTADYIARYNLETKEWLMLPMPQAESDIRRIEVDQNRPNRVWWVTNAFNARIGYLELL